MKHILLPFMGFLAVAMSSAALAQDSIRVGGFGREPVSLIAEKHGFLGNEGIRIEYTRVGSSIELLKGFSDGKFDLVQTNADNIIAWIEGQGADRTPHDFVIFMGGKKGVRQELVAGPEIRRMEDLRGKTLAVDAYNTGYAPVLVYMLSQHGLILRKDYDMKSVGGGRLRREAVKRGDAVGGFMSLDEELKGRGFHLLARSDAYISNYARAVGTARRDWAKENQRLLVRYIRAMIRATDWLLNSQNKTEAIRVLHQENPGSPELAEATYEESLDPRIGLLPRGRLDLQGIQTILEIREVMGEMKAPLPSPEKYIDKSYYQKALASLEGF